MDMEYKMAELREKKKKYFQNIYDLTLGQKQALADQDIEKLQGFIIEKQKFIDKIKEIDGELKSFGEEHEKESKMIIKEILEVDQENRQKAAEIFLELKGKLGKVRQGKKVSKAYQPYLSQSAFINKAR